MHPASIGITEFDNNILVLIIETDTSHSDMKGWKLMKTFLGYTLSITLYMLKANSDMKGWKLMKTFLGHTLSITLCMLKAI